MRDWTDILLHALLVSVAVAIFVGLPWLLWQVHAEHEAWWQTNVDARDEVLSEGCSVAETRIAHSDNGSLRVEVWSCPDGRKHETAAP